MVFLTSQVHSAQMNILIVQPLSGTDGGGIKTHLQKILQDAGMTDANVSVTGPSEPDQTLLSGWLHDPYHDADSRWRNLRGEDGTAWNYVVIMENPQVIETYPGWYAQGVHDVANEVERGKGEAVLLMQWPEAPSTTTLEYYREVTYRVGRGRDLKVIPAGLAWQAAHKPTGQDAAYLVAASIYSRLFNANAAEHNHTNDALARSAFDTVTANKGIPQYRGAFTASPTGIHSILGEQKRIIRIINDGHHSIGFPLETPINAATWKIVRNAGLINHVTDDEKRGGKRLPKSKVAGPSDLAYREYVYGDITGESTIRDTDSTLYVPYRWSHLIQFTSYEESVDAVKSEYRLNTPYLDGLWRAGDKRIRQLPNSLLLAQSYRQLQSTDEKVMEKLNKEAIAAYNFTLLTGRCPMIAEEAGTDEYLMQKLGYEAAWRFSTLHGRAPGFKTWPKERYRMTVDPSNGAVIETAFLLPPKANVKVSITTSNPIATVSPSELTFSPENYKIAQMVTVSLQQDATLETPFDVQLTTTSEDMVCDQLSQSWSYTVNRRPLADTKAIVALAGQPNLIQLTGSDPDATPLQFSSHLQPITYSLTQAPTKGHISMIGDAVIYTPKANATGADRFTFQTKDYSVFSEEATVNISIQKPPLYGRNLLINGSAEFAPFRDFGWVEGSGSWSQSKEAAVDGSFSFSNSVSATPAELYQDIDLTTYADRIAEGEQSFRISGNLFSNKGDDTRTIVSFMDSAQQVLRTHDSGKVGDTFPGEVHTSDLLAPVGSTSIRVILQTSDGSDKGKSANGIFDAFSLIALEPAKSTSPGARTRDE